MAIRSRVLIVGASVAGIETATRLARNASDLAITVVDGSAEQPYDRPPLSKQMLVDPATGRRPLLEPNTTIELVLGDRVVEFDSGAGTARLASGAQLGWDHAVIATGAQPHLPAWAGTVGARTLRTIEDAAALAEHASRGGSTIIAGGGLIGTEVASTLVGLGVRVDLVHSGSLVAENALGTAVARELTAMHLNSAAGVHLNSTVLHAEQVGSVTFVHLSTGVRLKGDLVIAAVGARADADILSYVGSDGTQGIPCDAFGRVIGLQNVYAVGDVSAWAGADGEFSRSHQHWTNAVEQARVTAAVIAGLPVEPHRPSHYVWTEQFGRRIERTGHLVGHSRTVVERAGVLHHLYADDTGTLVGAAAVGGGRAFAAARKAIRAGELLTNFIHSERQSA